MWIDNTKTNQLQKKYKKKKIVKVYKLVVRTPNGIKSPFVDHELKKGWNLPSKKTEVKVNNSHHENGNCLYVFRSKQDAEKYKQDIETINCLKREYPVDILECYAFGKDFVFAGDECKNEIMFRKIYIPMT